MSAESAMVDTRTGPLGDEEHARGPSRFRADRPGWSKLAEWKPRIRAVAVIATALGFVLLGGGALDLGEIESRLGWAAGEPLGPFGRVFGGWEPTLWPAQVAFSRAWALGE